MKIQYIIFYSIIALGFSSCKDDSQAIQPIGKLATVQLVFDNVVGDKDLLLDSTEYVNLFEQAFTVAKFNYFISNIELKMKDGTYVPVLQDSSYFLVKEKDPSSLIANLNWVNEGEYAGIRFMIGVDSLRNTMPLDFRTGMLDIGGFASDMYWTWNQGYIFMKLECHKPQSKGDPNPAIPYVYHIGGFGGMNTPTINNIKIVNLDFPSTLIATQATKAKVFIKANALQVLLGENPVDFEQYPTVMLTTYSKNIADNYSTMFTINSIQN